MTRIRVAAIIIKNNEILLMHRIKLGEKYYVFIGGGVEEGETKEEALLREVKEEANISISIKRPIHNMSIDGTNQYFYLCDYVSGEMKLGNGPEIKKQSEADYRNPVWVKLKELPNLVLYPFEVKDIVIFKYHKWVEE